MPTQRQPQRDDGVRYTHMCPCGRLIDTIESERPTRCLHKTPDGAAPRPGTPASETQPPSPR